MYLPLRTCEHGLLRIFKAETKGLRGEDDKQEAQAQAVSQPAELPAAPAPKPLAEERRVGVPDDRNSAT